MHILTNSAMGTSSQGALAKSTIVRAGVAWVPHNSSDKMTVTLVIITDAQNRVVQTSAIISALGPSGDASTTPSSLTVTPTTLTVGCGQTGTSALTGSGTYTAAVTSTGLAPGAFTVVGTAGAIPGTVSFVRNNGFAVASSNITVNVVAGIFTVPVTVTVPVSCP